MAQCLFDGGAEGLLTGDITPTAHEIRALLFDLADCPAITAASNATPIVITSNGHGLSNGDRVMVLGVGGNTNANNTAANPSWVVANVTANTFELQGSAGNSAYTSGGVFIDLTGWRTVDDLPSAGIVARMSAGLANKSGTNGILGADDATITSVSGDSVEAVIYYRYNASDSSARLLAIETLKQDGSAISLTPDGNNVSLDFSATGAKLLSLVKVT